ncbi:N(6)-adenine-specific methyltransferase METTL4 [Nothobranchius furzeri]|uniref:Methyltransferase like 4 n=2 Tax=Nothobranchius TaxID=28779 RepID=A0A1A8UJL1_NOTFU|nr:methyltransferase like 4 [Nothobranchius furzeri]
MSVVLQNSCGWVLDSRLLINRGYERCIGWKESKKLHFSCSFKRQCFQILKSYCSPSSTADMEGGHEHDDVLQKNKRPKKRKRKHSKLNQGEIDIKIFHEKIRPFIVEGTKSLVDSAQSIGYLDGERDTLMEALPSQECSLVALCEMAKELPLVEDEQKKWTQPLVTGESCASHVDLFSQVTENKQGYAVVVPLMGEEYVIPPNAAFLLSDFTRLQPLVQCGRRFDLIVIDPPWENKSVKRSRRYSFLPSSQLKRLPIPSLASQDCLVVTWVTNRPSHLRFVHDELYPHWGVQVLADWFWVKVTTSGEYVFPIDSQHKKPYEILVLGRYCSADTSRKPSEIPKIEDKCVIVSVPSALHSQKPSLSEVLRPFVGAEAECLELFARSLQPRWTSWGNEVLKFQHISYFNLTPAEACKDEATDDCTDEFSVPLREPGLPNASSPL